MWLNHSWVLTPLHIFRSLTRIITYILMWITHSDLFGYYLLLIPTFSWTENLNIPLTRPLCVVCPWCELTLHCLALIHSHYVLQYGQCYMQNWRVVLCAELKSGVVCRTEEWCYVQNWRVVLYAELKSGVMCRTEEWCYVQNWRVVLCAELKSGVMCRTEEWCYVQNWRVVLCAELKSGVMCRTEEWCYVQNWRVVLCVELKSGVMCRTEEWCYV